MLLDTFVNEQNDTQAVKMALLHRRVSMVGYNPLASSRKGGKQRARIPTTIGNQTVCLCCGRFSREPIPVNFRLTQIGFLGAGYAMYFAFLKLCMAMLSALLLILMLSPHLYAWLSKTLLSESHREYLSETDFACLLIFSICTFLVFGFAKYMVQLSVAVDEMDTSPEDYSLWVSNIPLAVPDMGCPCPYDPEAELRKFFQESFKQELKVAEVCLCYNLLPLTLLQHTKKQQLQNFREYYLSRDRKKIVSSIMFGAAELPHEVHEFYGVLPSSQANEKIKFKNIQEWYRDELEVISRSIDSGYSSTGNLLFLGQAIVSFEAQHMKEYLLNKGNSLETYLYGHKLKYRAAPHPKGIFWCNLHLNRQDYALRNQFSLIVCAAVLATCQLLVNYLKILLLNRHPLASSILSWLHLLLINLINLTIPSIMLHALPSFQGHRSRTQQMLSFVSKNVSLQLLNTLLLPYIVRQFMTHEPSSNFIAREQGILFRNSLFILIGMIVHKRSLTKQLTLKVFQRGYNIQKLVKSLVTLREHCEMYEFPQFQIDYRSAETLKTLLLTFVFAYETPKVVMFALVCFLCGYWIDKYNLARKRTVQYHIGQSLNHKMMWFVHLTITAFLVVMIIEHGVTHIKIVLAAVSIILCFNPAIAYAKARSLREKRQLGSNLRYTPCKRKIFETDYRRENPATKGRQKQQFCDMFADKNDQPIPPLPPTLRPKNA